MPVHNLALGYYITVFDAVALFLSPIQMQLLFSKCCETCKTFAYDAREFYRPSLALNAQLPLKDSGMRPGFGVGVGRHKACPYRDLMGLEGPGSKKLARMGTRYEYQHTVGEACCRRGGVAGAEPPHKGGPNRPDRPNERGGREEKWGREKDLRSAL